MKYRYAVVPAGLLLASLGFLMAERSKVAGLRQENERLREELAAAQRLIRAQGTSQGARQNEELERLRTEAREVHQLRNEVSRLRAGAREADQLRAENQQLHAANRQLQAAPGSGVTTTAAATSLEGYYPKERWAFSGYATPEAALQSAVWAMREGDTKAFLASLAPEEMEQMQRQWEGKSETEISADAKREIDKIKSIRVLESKAVSDDEVVLHIYAAGGEEEVQKISMKRFGTEWKMASPKKE